VRGSDPPMAEDRKENKMSNRIEELQMMAAWVGALQSDPDRFARLNCEANKKLAHDWLVENGYDVSPASVVKAFESFESTGKPAFAKLPDARVEAERRAAQEKAAADAAEAARLAEIAEANERESLLREVAGFHYRDRAQQESAIRNRFSYWSIEDLRKEAAARRLQRDSRNMSPKEFAEANGLTEKRAESKNSLVLSEDLGAVQLRAMSGATLRQLIKKYVVKGYPERVVLNAIGARINGVA
jgi:hypothetical protein